MPKEKSSIIKVLGVGGGGGNAVNYMFSKGIKGVDFIICNTDLQALEASPIPNKIQLGASLTQGLGAGSNPEVGKNSAMEAIEDIIDTLGVNTKMLFITAGMGGGTGTGAAPIIAKTAREMDILTVGIVTTPFSFEGKRRKDFAYEGIEALKNSVDCLLIISNDKIKEMYGNLTMRAAFGHANEILNTAAKGIAEVITYPGEINVDFEDVKTVMKSSGVALMGSAQASGPNRAIDAVTAALSSPLLNESKIQGAKNILLNVSSASGEHELLMSEFGEINNYIQEESGFTAEMIIGTSYDETLGDNISVTLIATGFESIPKENKIIIGNVETKQSYVPPVAEPKAPAVAPIAPKSIAPEPTKYSLEEEMFEPKKPEVNPNEIELNLRIEEEQIEDEYEVDIPANFFDDEAEIDQTIEERVFDKLPEAITQQPIFNLMNDQKVEDQEKKIEKHIQRIKTLKDLNISINTPQGLRDLEKEPAYKRKLKRLDDIPHSSATQVSRLSLFDDSTGKPEIKTNNSFLHDNVD
ncbi:MAG: cell division protein FtsZ [Bacteroidetes bacterium B1(2017)]|nr:MAG: cell division protein FtsZ [Bacteroidetes bacterium B1(2017)]